MKRYWEVVADNLSACGWSWGCVSAVDSEGRTHEAGNAEHSLHDLSSESSKECSLTEFNESCDRAKNYGGTKQAERHSAPEVFPRYCHSLVVACRDSKPCAQNGKFSPTVSKYLLLPG